MNRLAILVLAATALSPAAALAEQRTVALPLGEDVPQASLALPGGVIASGALQASASMAGHRGGAMVRGGGMRAPAGMSGGMVHRPKPPMMHGSRPGGAHAPKPGMHGPRPGSHGPKPGMHGPRPGGHWPKPGTHGPRPGGHGPKPGMHGPRPGWGKVHPPRPGGHHFKKRFDYHRIGRGHRIDRFWFSPRFFVGNWGLYGLTAPSYGDRWIRYYDDALLIDRDGVVRDYRYDLDWDRYGEAWGYDGGAPAYAEEYYEEDRYDDDGAYAEERYDEGYGHDRYGAYVGPAPSYQGHQSGRTVTTTYHGAYPGSAQGYYPPGTVITETIVTTSPTVSSHTYYVDEPAPRRKKAKRVYRTKTIPCDCAPAELGEKG